VLRKSEQSYFKLESNTFQSKNANLTQFQKKKWRKIQFFEYKNPNTKKNPSKNNLQQVISHPSLDFILIFYRII